MTEVTEPFRRFEITAATTERTWSDALDLATTLDALEQVMVDWRPFVDDAALVVARMTPDSFADWRAGLAMERQHHYAGDVWSARYADLLLPHNLLMGTYLAGQFHVPLGVALLRMQQLGKVKRISAPKPPPRRPRRKPKG